MRSALFGSLVIAIGLAAMPGAIRIASAGTIQQKPPAAVRVTAEQANVREGASTTATIITTVARGTVLDVVSVTGAWYRVRLRPSNREGFIAASTVEVVAAAAPTAPAPTATPAPAAPPPATQKPAAPAPPAPRPATPAPARPAAARPAAQSSSANAWHVRGFVGGEGFSAAAIDTFTALLGTPTFSGLTAGADVYGGALPYGLFARVGFSTFTAYGERVVVVDGESFPTGIPLDVKMRPIQIGAGIRYPLGRGATGPNRPFTSRLTPYAGAGVVLLTYQEISEFADDGENDAESFRGLSVFGGLDVSLTRFLSAGVEVELRQISGFGTGGISQEFGEDQLGGVSVKFMIGIGR